MCDESVARPRILFREVTGGGDDPDAIEKDGTAVTLSYWESGLYSERGAPSHYLLTSRVMIGRELVRDETEIIHIGYHYAESDLIRKAIKRADQMIELLGM